MAGIRPFEASDIAQVANLHQQVFGVVKSPDISQRYAAYFTDKFVNPVRYGALPSLVFEDENGVITGFIAVATRSFVNDKRIIRAAVSSQFIVDPRARSRLVAVALLKEFLRGPQDLSYTDEANEPSRILWEKLGGSASPLYSMHWLAPLNPANMLLSKSGSRLGSLTALAAPIANLIDTVGSVASRIPRRSAPSYLQFEALRPDGLANLMSESMDDTVLRPVYDPAQLERMLLDAAQPKPDGKIQGVLLRSGERIAGWYLYCLKPRGNAEVLQIRFRADQRTAVINHLFNHARRNGAAALAGRMEPQIGKALAGRLCLLYRREYLMLVHSREPQVLNAIHSGKAFISRLDGEWCLRFH